MFIPAAAAHPHVFIRVKIELIFNDAHELTAVRNIWLFDEFYSTFATQGLAPVGQPATREQLLPMARTNIGQMQAYGYFNRLISGRDPVAFDVPQNYDLHQDPDLTLVFAFTLPLRQPAPAQGGWEFKVFDPTYYIAYSLAKDGLRIDNPPPGCGAAIVPPRPLDDRDRQILSDAKTRDVAPSEEFAARMSAQIEWSCATP